MMINVFLDTNVLVHWLIIKKNIEIYGYDILDNYKKLNQSYEFIERILSGSFRNFRFHVSHLTFAEMAKAIIDFLTYEKMRHDGIAAIYWFKYFKDYLLTDNEFKEYLSDLIETSNYLQEKLIVINDENFDLEFYPYFIARAGLDAHDSLLLTNAIKNKMNYFVTMDRDFLDLIRERRFRKIREYFVKIDLKIVKPVKMIELLQKNEF